VPCLVDLVVEGLPSPPGTEVVRVEDGLAGAVELALRSAGLPAEEPVFRRIKESLAALRWSARPGGPAPAGPARCGLTTADQSAAEFVRSGKRQ
jgi:hypothetical protein